MTMQEIFSIFSEYMQSGGFVMWPLFVASLILWYTLGYRFHALKRGTKKSVRNVVRKHREGKRGTKTGLIDTAVTEAIDIRDNCKDAKISRKLMDDVFYKHLVESKKFSRLSNTIVISAPLTGLLGTVIGMIETFDSLASAALFSQSGGIAGGISQALFTTQLGLVVAVPGLIMGRFLDRKAENIEKDLDQIKDLLCSEEV